MSVVSSAGVLRKAVIAALVGIVAGVTAGVWSLRQPAASASVSASRVAAPAAATLMTATEPTRARTNPASPSADDDAQVLQRARALARRPDVTALMALRDDVVRHATERGIADSSSIKSELDEIDLRLNEARLLQLKLDAEELRKASSKAAR
jgi:hypothetical protein